jgi:hypothetical protein
MNCSGDKFMSHIAPLTPGNEKEVHNAIVQGLNWFKTELEANNKMKKKSCLFFIYM